MQTIEIEVDDNQVDNIKWLLSSIRGIKVKDIQHSSFLDAIKQSKKDIELNNIEEIDNIDEYIKN